MKKKNTKTKGLIKLFILTIIGAILFGLSVDLGIFTLGMVGGAIFTFGWALFIAYLADDEIFD